MIDFLKQYWQFISTGLLIVFYIVLSLISKKKKVVIEDGLLARIYTDAIELINVAESKYKNGSDKLKFVVGALVEKYPNYSNFLNVNLYDPFSSKKGAEEAFTCLVEYILSTPQKKG